MKLILLTIAVFVKQAISSSLLAPNSLTSIASTSLPTVQFFQNQENTVFPNVNSSSVGMLLNLYPFIITGPPNNCQPIINSTLLQQSNNLKTLIMIDDDCIDGTQTVLPDFAVALFTNPLIGGVIILEHTSSGPAGYYYKRGLFQRNEIYPNMPMTWMLWTDAQSWVAYLATNNLNSIVVAYTIDPNPWMITFHQWWPEALVDLFGLSSLATMIYGLQALIRYLLYYSPSATNSKKKGAPKFNLMFNIVCVEVFCNIWRMLFAFGEGNQILNRGISMFDLQVSFSLPQILVFGNAVSTLNAWIAMTKMSQGNPDELSKKLTIFHAATVSGLILFEVTKGIIFVNAPAAVQIPLTQYSIFFYIIVMISTCGLFFRGFCIFRSKMVTGAKSSSGKPSAIDIFMKRVNNLALILGFSLFFGLLLLLLYVAGGNSNPTIFVLTDVLGEWFFVSASFAQTSFAVTSLIKKDSSTVSNKPGVAAMTTQKTTVVSMGAESNRSSLKSEGGASMYSEMGSAEK